MTRTSAKYGLQSEITSFVDVDGAAEIEAARKRPEEFEKRLNNFINKTKENKKITGFGGIEKYY